MRTILDSLAVGCFVLALGCAIEVGEIPAGSGGEGGLENPGGAGGEPRPKPTGPVAVVFRSDYPLVYGDIEVFVDGRDDPILMKSGEMHSCKSPTLVLDVPELSFEAMSFRYFAWRQNLELFEDCVEILLDTSGLVSGVNGITTESSGCLPQVLHMRDPFTKIERILGEISQPWVYRPDLEREEDTWETALSYLFEGVMDGKAVAWGGALTEVKFEYWMNYGSEKCSGGGGFHWSSPPGLLSVMSSSSR